LTKEEFCNRIENLNVNRSGDRRAPHKPLLILVAISKLLQGEFILSYGEVEDKLRPLLDNYAPQVKERHRPALPYWHLRTDGVWEIDGEENLAIQQRSKFPTM